MKALVLPVVLLLFGPIFSSSPRAEGANDQMEAARRFDQSGDLQRSVASPDDTGEAAHQEQRANVARLFPEPLAGWRADPVRSRPASVAKLYDESVYVRYYFRDDGAEIALSLLANSPLGSLLEMAVPAPGLPQSENGPGAFELKGHRGTIKQNPDAQTFSINVFIGDEIVVHAKGRGLSNRAPIDKYLEALDLDGIRQLLGSSGSQ